MLGSNKSRWLLVAVAATATLAAGFAVVYFTILFTSPPSGAKLPAHKPDKKPAAVGMAGTNAKPEPAAPEKRPPDGKRADIPANDPEEWRGEGPHVLVVNKTKIVLPGAEQDGGPKLVNVLTYNERLVGPTIRVKRGTTLRIKVVNALPANDKAPPVSPVPGQEEIAHGFFSTNLHFHGGHVSPTKPADDVFLEIAPGDSFEYTYAIPADHPCGTFWYHPHRHGSVAYQIANGLAGALIVEGESSGKVKTLDSIPEIANAKERICVLQQFTFQIDKDGVGWVDPNDIYGNPDEKAYKKTAINGVVMPTYEIQPSEVQRWRFIHAGKEEGQIQLLWHKDGKVASPPRSMEIAVDGLATGTLDTPRMHTLYPGNRMDILLMAPPAPGEYYLVAANENENAQLDNKLPRIVRGPIAKLIVKGEQRKMTLPTRQQLALCKPYHDITADECKVKRSFVFDFDEKKKIFHINGVSYANQKKEDLDIIPLGSAEEWTLSSINGEHPFHVHINPFQLVGFTNLKTGQKLDILELGWGWRDTFIINKDTSMTIRMRFRDFAGKTVWHCHTLDHEDQGMMRTFWIGEPTEEQLIACNVPAPRLELPAASSMGIDSATPAQGNVILVFFQGMSCPHCTQELRNLLREARDLAGTGTTVVAVSSVPIAQPDKAVESLGVPGGLGFKLLVDESHQAFRAFGCYDTRPRHGLFVIDKSGTIRAKYVGDTPFADAPQVRVRVRQLLTTDRRGPLDPRMLDFRFFLDNLRRIV